MGRALEYLKAAAEGGDIPSQANLGQHYFDLRLYHKVVLAPRPRMGANPAQRTGRSFIRSFLNTCHCYAQARQWASRVEASVPPSIDIRPPRAGALDPVRAGTCLVRGVPPDCMPNDIVLVDAELCPWRLDPRSHYRTRANGRTQSRGGDQVSAQRECS